MASKNNIINSQPPYTESDFPYVVLNVKNDNSYPPTPGFRVYHWHEELQFVYVISGNISVRTLESEIILSEGEGVFINKNIIHLIDKINQCEYRSFLFTDVLVSFYPGGPAEKLTKQFVENTNISLLPFTPKEIWHNKILMCLQQLIFLEKENKDDIYKYSVLSELSKLWLVLIKNIVLNGPNTQNVTSMRLRKMLRYIEQHFSEDITLSRLAESAGVSKSECLRCFKSSLKITPYRYIMEFRLKQAANLLAEMDLPVNEIAIMTGFNSQSYFGKCFKEKTGYSPKEYRVMSIKQTD